MELCINGGILLDPANGVFSKQNVGIKDGRVHRISTEELKGDQIINADGLILCPGFIDVHMHEENYDEVTDSFEEGIFDCMLRMGVTTAIGGNCGGGPSDLKGYMEAIDRKGIPINLGMLVPHGSLREKAILEYPEEKTGEVAGGLDPKYLPASSAQLEKMAQWTEELLDIGCFGVSFGIRYIPGITNGELLTISKIAAKKGKLLAAHIRDDAKNVFPALSEFLSAAKTSGAAARVSHIGSMAAYGQMTEVLQEIEAQLENGMDVWCDCYPYDAFSTGIGETTYDDGFLERYGIGYEGIEIGEGPYRGKRCDEALFNKLRKEAPGTITIGHFMRQEEIEEALSHPQVLVASDGFMHGKEGHPRAAGTFPRVLSELVRKKKKLTLYQAVEKMTSLPAKAFSINRGSLGIGDIADMVLFDPEKIGDRATFEDPALPPEGIYGVFINGKIGAEKNRIRNRTLGRTVRCL